MVTTVQNNEQPFERQNMSSQAELLGGVAEAARRLLVIEDFDEAINGALEALARSGQVDRIYVLENKVLENRGFKGESSAFESGAFESRTNDSEDREVADCLYEWTALNIPRISDIPGYFPLFHSSFGDWLSLFRVGQSVQRLAGDRAEPMPEISDVAIFSLLRVPIVIDGAWWGLIACDDCTTERRWHDSEIAGMETAAACIGSAIKRGRSRQEKAVEAQARATALETYNYQLRSRDGLLKCVNAAAQCLVANDDLALALPATLQIIGEGTRQCRAYILRNSHRGDTDELIFNLHAEWDAPHIPNKMDSGAKFPVPVSAFPARLSAPLKAGQATQFLARELDGIAPEDRPAGQARSLLGVPINVAGEWWGLLGIDDCYIERVWMDAEIAVLETAATAMGNAIERDRTRRAHEATQREMLMAQERVARAAELEAANSVLVTRDRWLQTIATAASELLSAAQSDTSVTAALETIGQNLACDRLGIMQYLLDAEDTAPEQGRFRLLHEWDSSGTVSLMTLADLVEMPASEFPDWTRRLMAGESVGGRTAEHSESACSQMQSLGAQCTYAVPIFIGSDFWGLMFMDYCQDVRELTAAELAVFNTAAACVGGAIYREQMQRDQAARERTKLLGSVAEAANLLLRSTDYKTVLSEVVRLLGEAVECDRCSLTRLITQRVTDEGGFLKLQFLQEWCKPGVDGSPPEFFEEALIPLEGHFLEFRRTLLKGEAVSFLIPDLTGYQRDYMEEAHSLSSTVLVPIIIQGEYWGEFSFDNCSTPRPYEEAEIAVLKVAAESVGSAIARQAQDEALRNAEKAVLEEREKAARDRATELAKTNLALSETLNALTATPELNDFLGQNLSKMAEQIGACSAHLFLYDQAAHTLNQHITVQSGQIYQGSAPTDPDLFSRPIPADLSKGWEIIVKAPTPFTVAKGHPESLEFCWPDSLAWHRAQGHTSIVCACMRVGNQPLGFIGFAFSDRTVLTDEQLQFIQALTNQATLSLHLTRLADQTQAAALTAVLNDERTRLAREIHDTLAQSFTGISLQLEALRQRARLGGGVADGQDIEAYIRRARDLARKGLSEARRSVRALRSEALETDSLPDALQKSLTQTTRDTGLATHFYLEGAPLPLPDDIQLNLLRIAQEAITNALRYANATQLDLTLVFKGEPDALASETYVQICIVDDGIGFDASRLIETSGFGLIGIRERATRFGGTFELLSTPGVGTTIEVVIPLNWKNDP